jgi:hypothetical protein
MKSSSLLLLAVAALSSPHARADQFDDWLNAPAASPSPAPRLAPRIIYGQSCAPYQAMLEKRLAGATARLQDCFDYAFVRPDIVERMSAWMSPQSEIQVECEQLPQANWCAAATLGGQILLSPTMMLTPGSICYPDMEMMFVHEVGHLADLRMSPNHNEDGDTGDFDEVYSIQNYCMRPARNWLHRDTRTSDVVAPERVDCMRAYQEFTPETLQDPFWGAYQSTMKAGTDPCPAPATPPKSAFAPEATKRHGWLWRVFHH